MSSAYLGTVADAETEWVVCLGEVRDVRDGMVPCPRRRQREVPVAECGACRLLAWQHDERDEGPTCTTLMEPDRWGERMNEPNRSQEFTISGDEVVAKVKELIHEGNIRRLIIKNEDGRTMLEVPLTLGLVGAALLPVFAAIGAAAAIATRCTIVVERDEPAAPAGPAGEPPAADQA